MILCRESYKHSWDLDSGKIVVTTMVTMVTMVTMATMVTKNIIRCLTPLTQSTFW